MQPFPRELSVHVHYRLPPNKMPLTHWIQLIVARGSVSRYVENQIIQLFHNVDAIIIIALIIQKATLLKIVIDVLLKYQQLLFLQADAVIL